jgi:hypothetical protein
MYQSNQRANRSELVRTSINHATWRRGLHLTAFILVVSSVAFSLPAGGVCREGCIAVGGTVLGDDATTGHEDTAIGAAALRFEGTGYLNAAIGANALYSNTTGFMNVAAGHNALLNNKTFGNTNTAIGTNALYSNTSGGGNVAYGYNALFSNQLGSFNTAVGFRALYQNIGSYNVGLGFNAGSNLTNGWEDSNVCIGYNVVGAAGESNTTRISNIYSSSASARLVYVNSDNKIGTLVSSRRFKEEIKPMDNASEAIFGLKPVSFHYKKEIEPGDAIMFGLIAEEVEEVDPDLVTRDDMGKPYTVRYEAVNAMLLNEFLKQHRKVEEQGRRVEEQERIIEKHQAEIRALASQLQKLSDELATASPSGLVSN